MKANFQMLTEDGEVLREQVFEFDKSTSSLRFPEDNVTTNPQVLRITFPDGNAIVAPYAGQDFMTHRNIRLGPQFWFMVESLENISQMTQGMSALVDYIRSVLLGTPPKQEVTDPLNELLDAVSALGRYHGETGQAMSQQEFEDFFEKGMKAHWTEDDEAVEQQQVDVSTKLAQLKQELAQSGANPLLAPGKPVVGLSQREQMIERLRSEATAKVAF
jgi:hypothetical protein